MLQLSVSVDLSRHKVNRIGYRFKLVVINILIMGIIDILFVLVVNLHEASWVGALNKWTKHQQHKPSRKTHNELVFCICSTSTAIFI
jgi:hypothetical protein